MSATPITRSHPSLHCLPPYPICNGLGAGPKPVRDAAEVALDGPDDVSVLCAGAPAAVDSSGEANQQGGQGAAAAQQLQPLAAKESRVLQRHTGERALRQHGPQQRVVLQNARRHAAAAGGDKSR
jgi:hypothetical protein